MAGNLCFLACEHFQREFSTIIRSEKWDDVAFYPFPPRCIQPRSDFFPFQEILHPGATEWDEICLLGGSCIAEWDMMSGQWEGHRVKKLRGCHELLMARETVEDLSGKGAYLLTPGWLSHWSRYLKQWGFDQKTARAFFGESTTSLVLLDTMVDPERLKYLQKFAQFLDLPFQTIRVGLDFMRLTLANTVLAWRLSGKASKPVVENDGGSLQKSDYVMIFDLLGKLTGIMDETDVIREILDLFTVLFAPASLIYLPFHNDRPEEIIVHPLGAPVDDGAKDRLVHFEGDYAWTPSGKGFFLRIQHVKKTIGTMEIDRVLFPEHKRHYLNLALSVVPVLTLAINNARNYEKLQQTGKEREKLIVELQEALAKVKTLSGMLPICASCKKIRDDKGYWNQIESYIGRHSDAQFSHGICPDCARKLYPEYFKGDDSLEDAFPLPPPLKDI